MPRPRYREDDKTAVDKIEEAFWECLREGPYSKITIASIVRKAHLNRNTFYYHFCDVDEMARCFVNERLVDPILPQLLEQFMRGEEELGALLERADFKARANRICLIASRNSSPELRDMLEGAIRAIWSGRFGVDFARVDAIDGVLLEFTLGGLLAIFASFAARGDSVDPGMFADPRLQALVRQNFARVVAIAERLPPIADGLPDSP